MAEKDDIGQGPGSDSVVLERLQRYASPKSAEPAVVIASPTKEREQSVAARLEGPARVEALERLAQMRADLAQLEANIAMDPVAADQPLLDKQRKEIEDLEAQL